MFVELPVAVKHEENAYDVLVNSERVMWASPLDSGDTRLYMNVADDAGNPAELDIALSYEEVRTILTTEKRYEKVYAKRK